MQSPAEKLHEMTHAPVSKLILQMAGPSMAIMVMSAVYNMADAFFIGYLGTSEVAAVGVAFPVMSLIQAVGFFFGQGAGNFMARALGAGKNEEARRMAATSLAFGSAFMAALALPMLFSLGPLSLALGATETIRPHAEAFLRFILAGAPWMVAATILNQQLRFQGSARQAMNGMIGGALLNIALDPLFIFTFGLKVEGAALATMTSQIASFFILLAMCRKKGNVAIQLSAFAPSWKALYEIWRGGVPSLLRQALMGISTVFINHLAGAYGDAAIAAIAIVNRLTVFAGSLMLGFAQGFQPVCGFNYGAGRHDRVREGFWFAVRSAFSCLLLAAILLAAFAPEVMRVFRDDQKVIEIGAWALRLACLSLPLTAWITVCNTMTQTMGRAREASLLAMARQGMFLLPALFILPPLLGLNGILLSTPISDSAAMLFSLPIARHVLRSLDDAPK
jgi:putative MATE family efflux protein